MVWVVPRAPLLSWDGHRVLSLGLSWGLLFNSRWKICPGELWAPSPALHGAVPRPWCHLSLQGTRFVQCPGVPCLCLPLLPCCLNPALALVIAEPGAGPSQSPHPQSLPGKLAALCPGNISRISS